MDGLWLSDKILRLIREKKEQTTQFVMQGSTTERNDYNYMIGKFRVLEEIEDEIKEMYAHGMDFGSHSLSHPYLNLCNLICEGDLCPVLGQNFVVLCFVHFQEYLFV